MVVPLALSPSVPPGLGPVDLLIAFWAPFRIPPSPFLCHARSPPLLSLKRHREVIMWAVPPPRHGRGHGPRLPWLPTMGAYDYKDTGDARHRASRRLRRTAGDTGAPGGGGRHLNENTGGEEARGGDRDSRTGKVAGDMELGRGDLGGGKGGGDPKPSIDQRN